MGQCYTYFVSTLPHNQTKLYIEFHYDDLLLSHRNELKRSIPSSHSSAMYASRAHSSPSFLSLTISIWLTSEVQWNSKTNFRLLNSHLQIPLPTNSQGISLSNSHAFSFLCMLCHSCAMDLLFDSFDFVLRRGEKKGRGGGVCNDGDLFSTSSDLINTVFRDWCGINASILSFHMVLRCVCMVWLLLVLYFFSLLMSAGYFYCLHRYANNLASISLFLNRFCFRLLLSPPCFPFPFIYVDVDCTMDAAHTHTHSQFGWMYA